MFTQTEAYERCKVITKRASSTFYFGSLLLPSHLQKHIWAIYAYCRYADDIVDETSDPDQAWKELVVMRSIVLFAERRAGLYFGSALNEDMSAIQIALAETFMHFPLLQTIPFLRLIDGVERDLKPVRHRTFEELLDYCDHVAGGIGVIICQLCGFTDDITVKIARKMGNAMQLTNIVRDLGEDIRRNRHYLPDSLLAQHNISRDSNRIDEYKPMLKVLIKDIREMYAESNHGLFVFPKRVRFALYTASLMYEDILTDIEHHNYDVFSRRAFVGTHRKLVCLLRASALLL